MASTMGPVRPQSSLLTPHLSFYPTLRFSPVCYLSGAPVLHSRRYGDSTPLLAVLYLFLVP